MSIVPVKEQPQLARLNVPIKKSTHDDLLLYCKMLGDSDKGRVVDGLLSYSLKKDKDFKKYKAKQKGEDGTVEV